MLKENKAIELSNLPTLKTSELLRKLDQVALHGAAKLGPSYRWVNTFGFDMALDTKGRVWIIEVNLAPRLNSRHEMCMRWYLTGPL
ncbi:YheC/YheD family protein [Paenibacillus sp. 2RAB27]|uniref:YheC/YheD family protein n=1 Tax=Paenibacillus sp. 2RAB27 TaxID=3232991 RepID=UPI003F9870E5